ncbi:MAG: hypothetical protein Q8882_01210 [Bacillota bacterium]|nr:hypothetical protein [Bacillota bacterium]
MIKFSDTVSCENTEKDIINAVRKIYIQYQEFMNVKDLPEFKVEFFNVLEEKSPLCASVRLPSDTTDEYVLNISVDYIKLMQERSVPILYHEFTHILDHETILNDQDHSVRRRRLILYTEFHATIMQMKNATGFKNNDESKLLTLQSKIMKYENDIRIYKYLKDDLDSYIKTTAKYKLNMKDFEILRNYAIYHIAKKHFAKCYIKEDCSHLFNVQMFAEVLGEEVLQAEEILNSEKNDVQTILELHKINRILMERVINNSN